MTPDHRDGPATGAPSAGRTCEPVEGSLVLRVADRVRRHELWIALIISAVALGLKPPWTTAGLALLGAIPIARRLTIGRFWPRSAMSVPLGLLVLTGFVG